jgi:hypothetical protein
MVRLSFPTLTMGIDLASKAENTGVSLMAWGGSGAGPD